MQLLLGAGAMPPRPKQLWQPHQALSNLRYDVYKDQIQREWDEDQAARGITKPSKPTVDFRNTFMKARLAEAPLELLQEVEDHRQCVHQAEIKKHEALVVEKGGLSEQERELDPNVQDALLTLRSRQR